MIINKRRSDLISEKRRVMTTLMKAMMEYESLEREEAALVALGMPLTDADFIGENEGLHTPLLDENDNPILNEDGSQQYGGGAARLAASRAAIVAVLAGVPENVKQLVYAVRV
jgi:hypothetical protein